MKHHLGRLLAGILLVFAVASASRTRPPVTAKLRIEGPTRTLYEGWVTSDVRPFHFTGDTTMHACDGTTSTGGTSPTPIVTRGTIVAAAIDGGLQGTGTGSPARLLVQQVSGENVAYDVATGNYLVEYDHGTYAATGACSDPVDNGEEVLFAYGDGSQMALSLTGPLNVTSTSPRSSSCATSPTTSASRARRSTASPPTPTASPW